MKPKVSGGARRRDSKSDDSYALLAKTVVLPGPQRGRAKRRQAPVRQSSVPWGLAVAAPVRQNALGIAKPWGLGFRGLLCRALTTTGKGIFLPDSCAP